MAKKINIPKRKNKNPKEGDTVFLKGEVEHIAMLLKKISITNGEKVGFCVWSISKLVNDDLIHIPKQGEFKYELLTLTPPPKPTIIYKI